MLWKTDINKVQLQKKKKDSLGLSIKFWHKIPRRDESLLRNGQVTWKASGRDNIWVEGLIIYQNENRGKGISDKGKKVYIKSSS